MELFVTIMLLCSHTGRSLNTDWGVTISKQRTIPGFISILWFLRRRKSRQNKTLEYGNKTVLIWYPRPSLTESKTKSWLHFFRSRFMKTLIIRNSLLIASPTLTSDINVFVTMMNEYWYILMNWSPQLTQISSIFTQCPFFVTGSHPRYHVTFIHHISLGFACLWEIFRLFSFFMT